MIKTVPHWRRQLGYPSPLALAAIAAALGWGALGLVGIALDLVLR